MIEQKSELKDRITAKKLELQAKLAELKADTKGAVREKVDDLERELHDVEKLVGNGWDNLSEAISKKLNEWLKKDHK